MATVTHPVTPSQKEAPMLPIFALIVYSIGYMACAWMLIPA